MGYKGQTYQIPFHRGGLTANPNITAIPPEMMVPPTRNINLHENGSLGVFKVLISIVILAGGVSHRFGEVKTLIPILDSL